MRLKTRAPKTPQKVWDARLMRIAAEAASWSRDPAEGVGCLLVSPDRRSQVVGYNGVVADHPGELTILASKALKYAYCRHAERNAIANARQDLTGWTAYVTKAPCEDCALDMYAHGVRRVVCPPIRENSRWAESQRAAAGQLRLLGVRVEHLA
jgi:deoxycytidylate deaminase